MIPAAGLSVTGVTDRLGKAITTDENGYFLAVSENNEISFSIKSPYFDIANISNQAVNAAGVLTRQTVEFAYKTYENYVLLTTSQVMKFSRAYKLDLTAVGGGGGSTGVNTKSAFGAGGGGGYVETQLDIDVDTSDKLTVTIGAGGSIHYITNATTAGNPGGHTAVDKGSIRLVSAYGGTGSGVNNGVPFQGTGNGNGGVRSNSVVNPTNGTGFIFNDASLGLAGGGGGGGFLAGAGQTEMKGGTPNGANGGYVDTNNNTAYRAGSAGVGGGGGAGGSQQISTKADASPGGTGGVYIRFKSA